MASYRFCRSGCPGRGDELRYLRVFRFGGRVDIIEATRTAPGTVSLEVTSCNQNPFVAEVEQTDPGTYEVSVRTRLGDTGDACADLITIDIDAAHPNVVIVEAASGKSFDLLGTGQPRLSG